MGDFKLLEDVNIGNQVSDRFVGWLSERTSTRNRYSKALKLIDVCLDSRKDSRAKFKSVAVNGFSKSEATVKTYCFH